MYTKKKELNNKFQRHYLEIDKGNIQGIAKGVFTGITKSTSKYIALKGC